MSYYKSSKMCMCVCLKKICEIENMDMASNYVIYVS